MIFTSATLPASSAYVKYLEWSFLNGKVVSRVKSVSHFDNFDFPRNIVDFFYRKQIRENVAVLHFLVFDSFDFLRKIADFLREKKSHEKCCGFSVFSCFTRKVVNFFKGKKIVKTLRFYTF